MKPITTTHYQCEICERKYNNEAEARACESKPILHDKGVKVGDTVRITSGDGAGSLARVTGLSVIEPGWGPSAFDHTRVLFADVINSWGSRMLTFNSYEVAE